MLNLDIKFSWGQEQGECTIKDVKNDEMLAVKSSQLNRINPRFSLASKSKPEYEKVNQMFQNGTFTETVLENFHYIPYLRTAATYGVKLSPMQDEILSKNLEETISKTISRLSKDPRLLDAISDLMYDLWGKK